MALNSFDVMFSFRVDAIYIYPIRSVAVKGCVIKCCEILFFHTIHRNAFSILMFSFHFV